LKISRHPFLNQGRRKMLRRPLTAIALKEQDVAEMKQILEEKADQLQKNRTGTTAASTTTTRPSRAKSETPGAKR